MNWFFRPLTDFMATLHKNGMEEKKLSKYVTHRISDDHDVVTLSVSFPEEGQYGMDIYTRELRQGRTKMFFAVDNFSDHLSDDMKAVEKRISLAILLLVYS